jgi:hypothetical protein
MEPEITNDRAKREWLYIVERVGEAHATAAIGRLAGRRRPYPFNIAKVLGIRLPDAADLPLLPEALASRTRAAAKAMAEIKKTLGK